MENLKSVVSFDYWDKYELRVVNNTESTLRILIKADNKATFFILGWLAERCEELVNEINEQGHEVASHGYSHQLVYNMIAQAFDEDVKHSKDILDNITKVPVLGYKAPSFSITEDTLCALDILKNNGLVYDSSINQVYIHDRYGFSKSDSNTFKWQNGLIEGPLSICKFYDFNLPVAG